MSSQYPGESLRERVSGLSAPQPCDDPAIREALVIENDARYTAQANFLAAVWIRRVHYLLGIPTAITAAAAAATALSAHTTAAGILALAATLTAAVQTFVSPDQRAAQRHAQGAAYRELQNETRIFRTIDSTMLDAEGRARRIKELSARRYALNRDNAPVAEWLFRRVRKKLDEEVLVQPSSISGG